MKTVRKYTDLLPQIISLYRCKNHANLCFLNKLSLKIKKFVKYTETQSKQANTDILVIYIF